LSDLKITDVKAFTIIGEFPFEGEKYMEERLVQPIDIYPEYKARGPRETKKVSSIAMEVTRSFLEIKTDADITGIAPVGSISWEIIKVTLKQLLLSQDVLAIEKIWDQMYRTQVHGRKCQTMIAISAVDNCLWDIIGCLR
jgi:L-alanine-DL-glutamate epimerase-like enolase superfamily enzyme